MLKIAFSNSDFSTEFSDFKFKNLAISNSKVLKILLVKDLKSMLKIDFVTQFIVLSFRSNYKWLFLTKWF